MAPPKSKRATKAAAVASSAGRLSRRGGRLVVGVDLGGTHMQIGVVDQHDAIVQRGGWKTEAAAGKAAVIRRIAQGVREVCEAAGASMRDIAAVPELLSVSRNHGPR